MVDFVLFGGTTEGRVLAEQLELLHKNTIVCVATDYGEKLLHEGTYVHIHGGRMNSEQMKELLTREKPKVILDATHPYATEVSKNIQDVCSSLSMSYQRILRESENVDGVFCFTSMEELIQWLNTRQDIVFSSMGAKEATALTAVSDYENRVWVRILPLMNSLQVCMDAKYPPAHVICMQGPFSVEINKAMFHASGAGILVTKESGKAGGFEEKLQAAKECNMDIAVLCRPSVETGISVEEFLKRIKED